jgi:colanic acid biosynthesis glycosyl transferase WcaI
VRRLRVLILTHHYPPEIGAPQTRLSGTAAFLRSRGHDVRVVTAFPSYPTGIIPASYRGRVICEESIDGIPVHRTWAYARPGPSARTRLANQLSFAISALAALPLVGKRDVILVESPPLFLGPIGALFGLALGAPVVLHVSDLWPAVAIELGALRNPLAIRAAESFERTVYRLSRRIIVVTDPWRDQLVSRGVPAGKISLITNGVDIDALDPTVAGAAGLRLRSALSLEGKTVAVCVGTMSNVYDYDCILAAARALRHRDELRFLIVGEGSQRAALERQVAGLCLSNVLLLPGQPHERVPALLAASDISVTALRPIPFTQGQLPVRILEAMAMTLPIVLAGTGVARRLVEDAGAGLAVTSGDADGLAAALARLSADAQQRHELGRRGRQLVAERFSRATVAGRIEHALAAALTRPFPKRAV